jgi:chromosome partitioning protein
MRVISLSNRKGGVGKTSTCFHLAGALSKMGRKVLLVDNDPQASLTQGFWGPEQTRGLNPASTVSSVHEGLEPFAGGLIFPTGFPGIDLIPGSARAADFDLPLSKIELDQPVLGLRELLGQVEDYDLVLIDCPPNLNMCAFSALIASDALICPFQPEDFGIQGIFEVRKFVDRAREYQPALEILGFLLSMVVARVAGHRIYEDRVRRKYGRLVFDAKVPRMVAFTEAIGRRMPVEQYQPKGQAAGSIRCLAEELIARLDAFPRIYHPLSQEAV